MTKYSSWTFGKKIAAGFALSFMLLAAIGAVAYRSINALSRTSDSVAHTHVVLEHVASVLSLLKDAETGQRGYIVTGDESFLEPYQAAGTAIVTTVNDLRELTSDNAAQQKRIGQAEPLIAAKLSELKRTIEMRRNRDVEQAAKAVQAGEGKKLMDDLRRIFGEMEREERDLLKQRAGEVEAAVTAATFSITIGTLLCLLLVTAAGFTITRSLTSQIGSAVQHMQSSSSELQAASNQQATGAKEQSTAMKEITTTMSELLVTSKQIAESAQRVAHIAEETAKGARSGEQTVSKANDSIGGIKRQVDLIVTHMLDLGKKSQQIGGILEIINELAEQTNILAINATIEAAGAGEAGKRFAVVADEIRKLADRVGGSTKEIRGLIDEIRAAVNTTVMTTEGGTKAVDAGARQFSEVATAFRQIVSLVSTTTEAAREIELSTKQQSTAVEQVNIAVSNVAQATRETEASSSQTLQTASELTNLSRDLMQLIQPQANA
jgi:methyl-accepting chemotaxis protein